MNLWFILDLWSGLNWGRDVWSSLICDKSFPPSNLSTRCKSNRLYIKKSFLRRTLILRFSNSKNTLSIKITSHDWCPRFISPTEMASSLSSAIKEHSHTKYARGVSRSRSRPNDRLSISFLRAHGDEWDALGSSFAGGGGSRHCDARVRSCRSTR